MANKMLIDATHPEETRVVVLRGNRVEEFDFESANRKQLRGNIYLAKVTRVEPSLQAAFVDYGGNRHGFLAFSEIHPGLLPDPGRRPAGADRRGGARPARDADDEVDRRGGRARGRDRHRACGRTHAATKTRCAANPPKRRPAIAADVDRAAEAGRWQTSPRPAHRRRPLPTVTPTSRRPASAEIAQQHEPADDAPSRRSR